MSMNRKEYALAVVVGAPNIETDQAWRAHVDRRLRLALSRFRSRVAKVTVRFDDAHGACGGVDKRCQIDVALRPSGNVLIEDIDVDIRVVVDRATERAERAVEREFHGAGTQDDFDFVDEGELEQLASEEPGFLRKIVGVFRGG